jgi:hypothetical protein
MNQLRSSAVITYLLSGNGFLHWYLLGMRTENLTTVQEEFSRRIRNDLMNRTVQH